MQKPQKLQFGPQIPTPQLLDVAFGTFNTWHQAQEEERMQCE